MNAMGHHIVEVKNLLIQRELHMEPQLQKTSSQIQTIGAVLKNIASERELYPYELNTRHKRSTIQTSDGKRNSQIKKIINNPNRHLNIEHTST